MKFKSTLLFASVICTALSAFATSIDDEYITEQYWVSESAPTVLVAHGCSGDMPHYHEWAKQISEWGFNAVVVDSFTKRKLFNGTCGKGLLFPAERRDEIYRIAEKAKKITNQPVGLIGFSHGGNLVLHVGVDEGNKSIDAAVAYYPNCSKWGRKFKSIFDTPREDYKNPRIPVAVMYGEKDSWTPPRECESVVSGEKYETHMFPNSTHAFDMNLPDRVVVGFSLSYNKDADEKSRLMTKEFFQKALAKN